MKQWMKTVAMAAVVASAAWTARGDVGIGILAGYWDSGDIADDMTGFGGGTVRVVAELLPVLGVEARVGGWGMSDDFDARSPNGEWLEYDFEMDVVAAEAGLTLQLPLGPLTLFGGGGVGAYFPDGEIEGWKGPWHRATYDLDCDPEVGAYAFGGLEVALAPNIALVGEVRYTWLEVEPGIEDHGWGIADKETLDLGGIGVEIGVMFWL